MAGKIFLVDRYFEFGYHVPTQQNQVGGMFTPSFLLIKTVIFAAAIVFLFDEARQKNRRQVFWLGFLLVFFLLKEALLAYLLQRPPEPSIAPLGRHLGDCIAAALPLLRDAAFPAEIINHYFLVWLGLEMGFAAALREVLNSFALAGEKKQSRVIFLIANSFIVFVFVVLAFGVMVYQYIPDILPYYIWAFLWSGVQYLGIARLVFKAREGKGLSFNCVACCRLFILVFALASLAWLALVFVLAAGLVEDIPFVYPAVLWHLQAAAVLFLAWRFLSRIRANAALEAEGLLLQKQLAQEARVGVLAALSAQPVYAVIAQKAREIIGAEGTALFLTEEQDERMTLADMEGFFPPLENVRIDDSTTRESLLAKFKSGRIKLGKTFIGEAAAKAQAFEELNNLKKNTVPQTAGKFFQIRSALAFPLLAGNKVLGVLAFVNFPSSGGRFARQKKLLTFFIDESCPILGQLRRYQRVLMKKQTEREFSIAHEVQRNLMPRSFPKAAGADISAFSRIAKEGGGDYYDLLDFGSGRFGFACADIAGKGVAAALVVVIIRSIVRSNALPGRGASEVVGVVNDTISAEVGEERFASLFYCQYDARFRALNYCNAGHAPLLLYRLNHGSFAQLDTGGVPVGIEKGVEYGQAYCGLEAGDVALLYTDGVLEAVNADFEQFGMDRLQQIIRENIGLSACELTDKIHTALEDFAGGTEQRDDATLLLIKVT